MLHPRAAGLLGAIGAAKVRSGNGEGGRIGAAASWREGVPLVRAPAGTERATHG